MLINSANTDIQRIVDQLDASEYFNVKYVVHSPTEIEDLFAKNKIELAVAFADDLNRQRFDSEQIQIIADATDPNLAVTRGAYANGVLSKALAAMVHCSGFFFSYDGYGCHHCTNQHQDQPHYSRYKIVCAFHLWII